VKSALGERRALLEKVGESREPVGLVEVGERAELMGPGVDKGKKVELFVSHGESCSKLGGEYDGTGVVPLPGVEELSGFSTRAGVLEVFREGVRGPEEEWQGRGLLENFWLVLEGEGLSLEISIDS